MSIDIFPLRRLPRSISSLTYIVPQNLETSVAVGQLVEIPFLKSNIFGIIKNIEAKDTNSMQKKMKEISSIVVTEPLLSREHLALAETLSAWYSVTPNIICSFLCPPLQKRKLSTLAISPFPKTRTIEPKQTSYTVYATAEEHRSALETAIDGVTLILVPEVHLALEVLEKLPKTIQENAVIWHSSLSAKKQFELWEQVRNNKTSVIIGTRGAIFLPFFKLDTVIIDYEQDDNHKQWDQAPRFQVKDVAQVLQSLHGATLHLMSFSPSAESYFFVHKNIYESKNFNLPKTLEQTHLINMLDERRGGNYGVLSDYAKSRILEATEDVFIYVNRRGSSTSLGCRDCGYVSKCPSCILPLVHYESNHTLRCHYCRTSVSVFQICPQCRSTLVDLRGAGTELVETELRHLLGGKSKHAVIRIDADVTDIPRNESPRVIVGTDKAFANIRWDKTEHICAIDIDRQLAIPEFTTGEQVWHRIQEMHFRKRETCTVSVQTSHLEHLLFRSLSEPDRFYRTELNARRSMHYPPYVYLVRTFFGHPQKDVAKKEAERMYAVLSDRLTSITPYARLSHPIEMQPPYFRKNFWYTITVRLPIDAWQSTLPAVVALFPPTWKIDPNPISLLSP